MRTFAHTETGLALEPQPASSPDEYFKFVGWNRDTSAWRVEEVPEGTLHDAKSDGQGGWVNPVAPVPEPQPDPIEAPPGNDQVLAALADLQKQVTEMQVQLQKISDKVLG